MFSKQQTLCLAVFLVVAWDATAESIPEPRSWIGAAERMAASLAPEGLRGLAAEVLTENPEIARAERLAAVAAAEAPKVRALPDPVAALSIFVLPPETRTGPQRWSASIQQKLPWFGKLDLRERVALYHAAAVHAEVETVRLDRLLDLRRWYYELAFLESYEGIVQAERSTLVRYEKAALAQYEAGTGLQQGIVRIQAQITRTDTRLLEISERRSALRASINRLRDRPASVPIGERGLNHPSRPDFDADELKLIARVYRPERAVVEAELAAAASRIALAEKGFRPDLSLGLSFTSVGSRDDAAGRLNPPEDDGDDILALSAQMNLPVWKRKLEAGLSQAQAAKWVVEEEERALLADIESRIGDLTTRMPLLFEHFELLENVLIKQAREALRSAETAYSTGKLNAVDLLDAEVVLLEVQIASARTRTDLAVAWAELERAVARPLLGSPSPASASEDLERNQPHEP